MATVLLNFRGTLALQRTHHPSFSSGHRTIPTCHSHVVGHGLSAALGIIVIVWGHALYTTVKTHCSVYNERCVLIAYVIQLVTSVTCSFFFAFFFTVEFRPINDSKVALSVFGLACLFTIAAVCLTPTFGSEFFSMSRLHFYIYVDNWCRAHV